MTEALWLLVVMGGPLVIGVAIAYALLTRRRRSPAEALAQRRATRRLYEEEETPAPGPLGEVLTPDAPREPEAPPRPRETPATRSLRAERAKAEDGDVLEEGLEETFPASDPVSATSTTTSGAPKRQRSDAA